MTLNCFICLTSVGLGASAARLDLELEQRDGSEAGRYRISRDESL